MDELIAYRQELLSALEHVITDLAALVRMYALQRLASQNGK